MATKSNREAHSGPESAVIVPCLWFDGQAEEAALLYTQAFPQGHIPARSYSPSSENPSEKPSGSVLTVAFEIGGQRFTAINGGPVFKLNPSISFFAHVDEPEDADRLFGTLAEGGQVMMPLDAYPWSKRYGWVQDRFGVSWQVMAGRRPPGGAMIVPCLMFSDAQQGRAYEAMQAYTEIFPDGRIEAVESYVEGEGPKGSVKHGRFIVAGQEMVAMDSHVEHGFSFNEALSLQVMCKDQDEVNRYWDALSDGGEAGRCGWLKDRFGVSWQVVPTAMGRWMGSPDASARDRAFVAMMGMTRLDIATLQAAFDGA